MSDHHRSLHRRPLQNRLHGLHFLALQLELPEVSSYLLRFDNAIELFHLHDKSSDVVYNFEYVFGEGSMDRFRNEHQKCGT